jgi:hypothetical protein
MIGLKAHGSGRETVLDEYARYTEYALRLFAIFFSWPVVIGLVVYWFRASLIELIRKIELAKGPGFELRTRGGPQDITLTTTPVEQPLAKDPIEKAPADQKAITGQPTPAPASTGPTNTFVQSTFDPQSFEAVVKRIKDAPELKGLNPEQREDYMARAFADKLMALTLERIYRIIFGSQIEAIAKANIGGGVNKNELRFLFDNYKKQFPEYHSKRTFDEWFGYLLSVGLVTEDANANVQPTQFGKDFLHYILSAGLPYQKPG